MSTGRKLPIQLSIAVPSGNQPRADEIAIRAYQLYEHRGGVHGHDLEDWFEAERQLRVERKAQAQRT